jgi:hypothetical protein
LLRLISYSRNVLFPWSGCSWSIITKRWLESLIVMNFAWLPHLFFKFGFMLLVTSSGGSLVSKSWCKRRRWKQVQYFRRNFWIPVIHRTLRISSALNSTVARRKLLSCCLECPDPRHFESLIHFGCFEPALYLKAISLHVSLEGWVWYSFSSWLVNVPFFIALINARYFRCPSVLLWLHQVKLIICIFYTSTVLRYGWMLVRMLRFLYLYCFF